MYWGFVHNNPSEPFDGGKHQKYRVWYFPVGNEHLWVFTGAGGTLWKYTGREANQDLLNKISEIVLALEKINPTVCREPFVGFDLCHNRQNPFIAKEIKRRLDYLLPGTFSATLASTQNGSDIFAWASMSALTRIKEERPDLFSADDMAQMESLPSVQSPFGNGHGNPLSF